MAAAQPQHVYGDRVGWVTLGPEFNAGGEVSVFPARHRGRRPPWRGVAPPPRNLVVALYHDASMPAHLPFLVETIEQATGGSPGVVRLRGAVRSQPNGDPVGFAMDRVRGQLLSE